ncbi:condensin complex component cnd2 [Ephemerocybe angulata]|uniref:Condensin complex subunit 2 n=1 Tax=Ephemerocybe angulata TaxID=980116 RepID=A0A8H6HWE7_9AGAR|nr:condensin complex component cnd2 [Tulosesus angulatus]
MAPAATSGGRRARQAEKRVVSEDEDSDVETPRPSKHRKRLSEAYIPDGPHQQQVQPDPSFAADNVQRVPLKSVNINDDEAEKRRRRKSAKMTVLENAVAGPSSEGANGDADASRSQSRRQQPLNAVAAVPAMPKPSIDVMTTNFEEWMKMATDNKINATNSWNFALIDYFHDMSLLRNNDDNSINFQRASCTLDGCVKIWTSRVDSVGTETGKLLSNLASGGKDNDDEDDSDNPDADPSQPKKKKPSRSTNTLAKDYNQLTNKKLELEFSVDPLFKKTCADFDEGGAGGLLLNHLSLGLGSDGGMRVIFDASDSVFQEEAEVDEEPEDLVDISELRAQFLPDFSVLEDKVVSRSLAGFSFNEPFDPDNETMPTATQFTANGLDDDDDDDSSDAQGGQFGMDVDGPPVEDYFAGPEAINDDYGYGGGGGDEYGGDGEGGSAEPEDGMGGNGGGGGGGGGGNGPFVQFDPRSEPNQRELILAMTDADGGDGALDYFDNKFKNWAGPEHWKMRRPIRKMGEAEGSGKAPVKGKKARGEPQRIDFLTPAEKTLKELSAELFAPPGKGQSINLPGTGVAGKKGNKRKRDGAAKKDEHLLPDDMHFSSKQLVTLFLKPKFVLKMRGKKARMNADSGEIDDQYWTQVAVDQRRNEEEDGEGMGDGSGDIPFATQFMNDDDDFDDGPGFGDDPLTAFGGDSMANDAGEQDLLAATAGQTRRVKPEFVNYAKRAKRVDVRKLKDNIWKGLDIIVVDDDEEEKDVSMDIDDDEHDRRRSKSEKPPTDPTEARQFSQVINGLQRSYPKDKMEEISTSFCFICLLHLANEQGLKLEGMPDGENGGGKDIRRGRSAFAAVEDDEEEVRDTIIPDDEDDLIAAGVVNGAAMKDEKAIGEIWDIKIYRDPNATRSA